jgi:hypothetical protein
MISVSLSEPEKQALEERHKACRDKREYDLIKTVLLCNGGCNTKMISQALRKHEDSIKRHLTDYIHHQKISENRHGSMGYLNQTPTQELIERLSNIHLAIGDE